ncbi:hypothetical protein D1872_212970 [compost metagenome]
MNTHMLGFHKLSFQYRKVVAVLFNLFKETFRLIHHIFPFRVQLVECANQFWQVQADRCLVEAIGKINMAGRRFFFQRTDLAVEIRLKFSRFLWNIPTIVVAKRHLYRKHLTAIRPLPQKLGFRIRIIGYPAPE